MCACATASLFGCELASVDASLEALTPATASSEAETPAVLSGERLFAAVRVALDDDEPATIDRGWRVRIATVELAAASVHWIDPEQIDLVIPAGLEPGVHDVVAIAPDGTEAILADGLTIDELDPPIEEELVGVDPFGDGTASARIVSYRDRLYVGPNAAGDALLRFDPDGTGLEPVALRFPRDTSGNSSTNLAAAPPYPGIGGAGCVGASCGPDGEDGHGVLASGTVGGVEWLVLAGARSAGDLDYVYLSSDADATVDFQYVDLSAQLGSGVQGTSAARAVADRWYFGFAGDGGDRPALVGLETAPTAPGLDATSDDAQELDTYDGQGSPEPIEQVHALAELGGQLYVFLRDEWLRTDAASWDWDDWDGTDWVRITPIGSTYHLLPSIASGKTADLEPVDRAVPQVASFAGRLFVARNTEDGPQLWACAPALSDDPEHCDRTDWTLIAPNSLGDDHLSQFDDAGRTRITMLVATATHLYVGYDDPDGFAVLRTADPAAMERADFQPHDAGLGDPARTRILDAVAPEGLAVPAIYLITGDGNGALSIHVLR